jgi:hypothetical protein
MRSIADLLAIFNIGGIPDAPSISDKRLANQTTWHAVAADTMYSASQEEKAIYFCFCDCQVI